MKRTIYLKASGGEKLISAFVDREETFTIRKTNYSTMIIKDDEKYIFSDSSGSNKLFCANSKIKADIKKTDIILDEVPHNKIKFYGIDNYFDNKPELTYFEKVYNVDIKSAYPTALKNMGFITDETYNYLHNGKLKKIERLKAVGMLGVQTIVYEFNKGVCRNAQMLENKKNRNIFKAVCYEVGEIMHELKVLLGDNFLFFWVDGIYFTDGTKINEVLNILKKKNYNFSVDTLNNFTAEKSNSKIYCTFEKDGKVKPFNLPIKRSIDMKKYINL